MTPRNIKEVKQELAGIDALIKEAIADQDIEEATSLESRKKVLPQILEQLEKNAEEIEATIDKRKATLEKAEARYNAIVEANAEAERQIKEIKANLANGEEYSQALSAVMSAQSAYYGARSNLGRLRS